MSQISRRTFVSTGLAAGVVSALPARTLRAANANDEINVGFISCGSRAKGLMGSFAKIDGVNIAGLCDPDEQRLKVAKERYPRAQTWQDLRGLIAQESIDAVVVATCNHWHCLAAIWAMQAGKDVYVEKPLSHSQWEGQQTIAAAHKYNRICQVGTQQRSDPMQAQIKKFLHEEQALGDIHAVRVNRYGVRNSIGKRAKPLVIDKSVAYDLWLGPAQDQPIYRDNLHYDWHWDWNTGSGEMGNWGVHVLDDVRNNIFRDQVKLPRRIFGGGGRVVWNDAGNTPNVHYAFFDTGSIPVVIGLSNLPDQPGVKGAAQHPGPGSGYVAYCEGGRFEGQRGRGRAFDQDGKVVKEFRGGGGNHQSNFIDAVRQRNTSLLKTDVQVGHYSTGWCNLANIAFQAGQSASSDNFQQVDNSVWEDLIQQTKGHLKNYGLGLDGPAMKLSAMLEFDPEAEKFVGEHAATANPFLRREYRKGFEVPELALG